MKVYLAPRTLRVKIKFSHLESKITRTLLIIMLGLLMSASTITEAAEESKASLSSQFSEAYRSYTTAKNNGNKSEIHRYAMQALLLGELVYGEDYKNTGALAMNAALSYPTGWQGMPGADSLALIRKLVSRYESLFGPESADIVEPLLLLAEVLFAEGLVTNEDESRVQTRKRIENAEEELNQVSERIVKLLTEFNEELDTGAVLTRLSRIRIAESKEIALTALETHRSALGETHPPTLSSGYFYANNYLKKSALLEELKL